MQRERPSFDLLIEDAGAAGCLGHIPALPGLCFRGRTPEEAEESASARIVEYVRWLVSEGLRDLTPTTETLAARLRGEESMDLHIAASERVDGAPVWESGNAAALFEHDLHTMPDNDVRAHLRFVRCVFDRVRRLISPLPASQRVERPMPDRRSIDETLEHIGNCVWWYCSRIDDDLP